MAVQIVRGPVERAIYVREGEGARLNGLAIVIIIRAMPKGRKGVSGWMRRDVGGFLRARIQVQFRVLLIRFEVAEKSCSNFELIIMRCNGSNEEGRGRWSQFQAAPGQG